MNLEKLKDVETEFLLQYPSGFQDAKFFPTMKKFDPSKLEIFTKENEKVKVIRQVAFFYPKN